MQEETLNWENFARHAIHSAFDRSSRTIDFESLEALGLKQVFDEDLKKHIFESYRKKEFPQDKPRGMMRLGIQAIPYKRSVYIILHSKENTPLLFSTDYKKELFPSLVFPFVAILFVLFLYIAIIRSLLPLNDLKSKIKKFSDGDYSVTCESKSKDEIGALANEFHNAVKKIRKLRDSRQLFLRNIMHELKTPITKGRISVEMIQDEKQKKRLIGVFEKLELLINEFASIEQITSGAGLQNVKPARLLDIIDESIDLAMVSTDKIKIEVDEDLILHVDFRLFTTAIKNLIDNAIKYSIDHFVIISTSKDRLSFISKGSALQQSLEHYVQPFTQEKSTNHGFGLGLYIVDNIAKAHHLKFTYKHNNGYNYFNFEKIDSLL